MDSRSLFSYIVYKCNRVKESVKGSGLIAEGEDFRVFTPSKKVRKLG